MRHGLLRATADSSRSPRMDQGVVRPTCWTVARALRPCVFLNRLANASAADLPCLSCDSRATVAATSSGASAGARCPLGRRWRMMPGVHCSTWILCDVDSPPLLRCCRRDARVAHGGRAGRFERRSWSRCRKRRVSLSCVFCRCTH